MSRTITALFDTRADAEAARDRLKAASIDTSSVNIVDQTSAGLSATGSAHESQGMWASIKNVFVSHEDRPMYEEGVRRGGVLLTASVEDHHADQAVKILDEASAVDIDGRANEWRAKGWDQKAPAMKAATGNEERIPVVEETIRVGKREVGRGGVRVRSYIVETPVSEQVNLREEHVSVDRHAVKDGTVPADAFEERTIEMTETNEEAVVAKNARVVEEIVVRKDVGNRTETISDSVRKTEVEVDHETAGTGAMHDGKAGTLTCTPGWYRSEVESLALMADG